MTYLPDTPRWAPPRLAFYAGLWAATVSVLSLGGVFTALPLPAFGVTVGLLLVALVAAWRGSLAFQRAVERIGLRPLTALHLWRIPAALAFFWAGSQGTLPPVFVALAGWGDLLAGLLAGAAVVLHARWGYWAMHVVGMADFVLAVGTGLTLSLLAVPEMATIAAFPYALIPLFGVTLSGATHVMAFAMLRRGRGM